MLGFKYKRASAPREKNLVSDNQFQYNHVLSDLTRLFDWGDSNQLKDHGEPIVRVTKKHPIFTQ